MEILIGIVLLLGILLLAGVTLWHIFIGILVVFTLAALFATGFFAVCWGMMLRSHRKKAHFTRFEEGKRFEAAVYTVDGVEYANMFPAEFILRPSLYRPEREVTVLLRKNKKGVFDLNARITSLIGLPAGLFITVVSVMGVLFFAA